MLEVPAEAVAPPVGARGEVRTRISKYKQRLWQPLSRICFHLRICLSVFFHAQPPQKKKNYSPTRTLTHKFISFSIPSSQFTLPFSCVITAEDCGTQIIEGKKKIDIGTADIGWVGSLCKFHSAHTHTHSCPNLSQPLGWCECVCGKPSDCLGRLILFHTPTNPPLAFTLTQSIHLKRRPSSLPPPSHQLIHTHTHQTNPIIWNTERK